MTARTEIIDGIAVITWDNPPVNALDLATRRGIAAQIDAAQANAEMQGIVLAGAGKNFSAGADMREIDTPAAIAAPTIIDLANQLDAGDKPVVAALRGVALGGGLELALACDARVAAPGTRLGMPEVTLGVLPGAGGTQRLPRLLGAERALELMIKGTIVGAEAAADLGLVDRVDAEPVHAALAMARAMRGGARRRTRDMHVRTDSDPQTVLSAGLALAEKTARGAPAPREIAACVEAAMRRPFADGVAFGVERFQYLAATPESKALLHAFFAERRAGTLPDLPADTPTRPITTVGVVGAGTMGTGIAMAFANAGLAVRIIDSSAAALERSRTRIAGLYASAVKRGRINADEAARRQARIAPAHDFTELADADLVIEAVIEDMAVKRDVFRSLDAVARPGAILATNTSFLNVDVLAASTGRPGDVLGLHFFSPADIMRLLEIVRGRETAPDVLATALRLARTIGKLGVVCGVCDGFIGNRMIDIYILRAYELVAQGATPAQVDTALQRWGMAMGPFAMSDLAGNDIAWHARRRKAAENPRYRYPRFADDICELGWFGQKTGTGWFRYVPCDRTPHDNPDLARLVAEYRVEHGITPRAISDGEIVERCIYALVNEGARIVDEGIAARASDIDLVYLNGYGFPALRGGPMHYADSVGLAKIRDAIAGFVGWEPAPLLLSLAARNGRFTQGPGT